jgi:hypothetical protein
VLKRSDADAFDIEIATVELRDILVRLKKWKSAEAVIRRSMYRLPGSEWLGRILDLTQRKIEWEPPEEPRRLQRVK